MTRGLLRFLRGNTIALLALFVALGGTTYAATALAPNSVGARQLKKNAVTNPKIKNNAVNGAKIANDTVKAADVLESSLGKVPSAANADNATHATSADSAAPSGAAGGALAGTYPNPNIATSTRGVALAGVTSPGTGVNPLAQVWFNRLGGIPTITHPSTGNYTITIPGLAPNVTTNVIAAGNGPSDDQVSVSSGGGQLLVKVFTAAGAADDSYFSVMVFGGSSAG